MGFLGVDIFFVISGFLITKIITRDIETQKFSLIKFYKQRIRRIFPALLTVLLTIHLVGYSVLLPIELERLGWLSLSAALFSTNIALTQALPYFNPSQAHSLLLHLWSLGIEEQFYLVWPLLLLITPQKKSAYLLTLVIMISSWGLFQYWFDQKQNYAFYFPLSRFWELACGAIIAFREEYLIKKFNKKIVISTLLISIITITVINQAMDSFETLNKNVKTIYLLIITIAGCIIVWGEQVTLVAEALSSRIMVYIGKISFPLYLWHWPILTFSKILHSGGHTSLTVKCCLVTLTVFLSVLTYEYIERPIRQNLKKDYTAILIFFMVCVGLMSVGFILTKGVPDRFKNTVHYGTARNSQTLLTAEQNNRLCEANSNQDFHSAFCPRLTHSDSHSILVWGDSQAQALLPGIAVNTPIEKGLVLSAAPGCAPFQLEPNPDKSACQALNLATLNWLKQQPKVDIVILVFSLDHLNADDFTQKVHQLITTLNHFGKHVFLYQGNPKIIQRDRFYNYYCFPRKTLFYAETDQEKKFCEIPIETYRAATQSVKTLAGIKGMHIIDPTSILCPNNFCTALLDGQAIYSFTDHLSIVGAELVGRYMIEQIERTLASTAP